MCHHETLAHQEEKLKMNPHFYLSRKTEQKMQGKTNNEDLCKIFIGGALYDLNS
jgi:hypothetical protein